MEAAVATISNGCKLKKTHKNKKKHHSANEESEIANEGGQMPSGEDKGSVGAKSKLKKTRKNKKNLSANEESEIANEGGQMSSREDGSSVGTKSKLNKTRKDRKKHLSANEEGEIANEGRQMPSGEDESSVGTKIGKMKKVHKNKRKKLVSTNEEIELADKFGESNRDNAYQISTREEDCSGGTKNKLKKARKSKRKDHNSPEDKNNLVRRGGESCEIYQISSGDEESSKGMGKWVEEYYMNRLGLEVLQQKIDEFITAHEEQEEQARKDREAKIAEDGWTVVVHRKGGKKTSDPESGVAVGSVSQGSVLHKLDKKRSKEVGLDFYRFQRREAQRSEVMKLQSKFEEDKKRIQQLRAPRKFKPY